MGTGRGMSPLPLCLGHVPPLLDGGLSCLRHGCDITYDSLRRTVNLRRAGSFLLSDRSRRRSKGVTARDQSVVMMALGELNMRWTCVLVWWAYYLCSAPPGTPQRRQSSGLRVAPLRARSGGLFRGGLHREMSSESGVCWGVRHVVAGVFRRFCFPYVPGGPPGTTPLLPSAAASRRWGLVWRWVVPLRFSALRALLAAGRARVRPWGGGVWGEDKKGAASVSRATPY